MSSGGGGDSGTPVISADARFLLFGSTANNLALSLSNRPFPGVIPPALNVFLRDRSSNTTTLVSISPSGSTAGNGPSFPISISTNGQYVLFESSASNLVEGDTNNSVDVFVRDLLNKVTFLISSPVIGTSGNGTSRAATMTPDGHFVVFLSGASNLVAGDTNGIPDVFIRDLQSNTTALVSIGAKARSTATSTLVLQTEGAPDVSHDGRLVLFSSTATNLVPGVIPLSTSGNEIYLRDRLAGTNLWISEGARTAAYGVLGTSNLLYFNYLLSADGQFVVYQARKSAAYTGLMLRYAISSGITQVIHTNALVTSLGDNRTVHMTPDGRFVTFVASQGQNLGTNTYILVWDDQTGLTTLVSGDPGDSVSPGSTCDWPAIVPDGRFIAFLSSATNLVTNTVSAGFHLYVRDTQMATTSLVDRDTNGMGSSFLSSMPAPSVSADGRFVAFESADGSFVGGDNNRALDVFVRDMQNNTVELVSEHHPVLASRSPNGPTTFSESSLSTDARYFAFSSDADNVIVPDTNGYRDVFVRDLVAGTNILVSIGTNGVPADGPSTEPTISGNGRYVAFSSRADNLVAGDTNRAQDVFVRDLQTGTTVLASADPSGISPGTRDSYLPFLNNDGSRLLFRSQAANLVPGTVGENLFARDLVSATTYALTTNGVSAASMTPDGRYVAFVGSNGPSSAVYLWDAQSATRVYTNSVNAVKDLALSPDGNRMAYWVTNTLWAEDRLAQTNWLITSMIEATRPGMRFSLDGRFLVYSASGPQTFPVTNQVSLYDYQTGNNLLVSQSWTSALPGNNSSDSPDISSDGRFVSFRSAATNLVPGDTNGVSDIFLFDRVAGAMSLVSVSRFGNDSADNRSLSPRFTGGGQTLLFESVASDLATNDFNAASDIFSWTPDVSPGITPFSLTIVTAGQSFLITWRVLAGRTCQVQYKNTLDDQNWQNATGHVTIVGDAGSFQDVTPTASQRFYRVVAF